MDLTKPIKVQAYFFEPDQLLLEELSVKTNRWENTREVIFYSIDNLSEYNRDGDWCCAIASGGTDYLTPLSVEQVERLIERNR